jgi:hypothetical protein
MICHILPASIIHLEPMPLGLLPAHLPHPANGSLLLKYVLYFKFIVGRSKPAFCMTIPTSAQLSLPHIGSASLPHLWSDSTVR